MFNSEYSFSNEILANKLKYGMGVALFKDETVYLKEVAKKAHVEFSMLETKKSFENLVGKDINANNGLGSNYELRVYGPNYPIDKKNSRWIEIESSNTGLDKIQSAHFDTNGNLDRRITAVSPSFPMYSMAGLDSCINTSNNYPYVHHSPWGAPGFSLKFLFGKRLNGGYKFN